VFGNGKGFRFSVILSWFLCRWIQTLRKKILFLGEGMNLEM